MVWFVQTVMAVSHMHDQRMLHRDIKADNVLLKQNGMIKVADFGTSKMFDTRDMLTRTETGTPSYMCPEISQG